MIFNQRDSTSETTSHARRILAGLADAEFTVEMSLLIEMCAGWSARANYARRHRALRLPAENCPIGAHDHDDSPVRQTVIRVEASCRADSRSARARSARARSRNRFGTWDVGPIGVHRFSRSRNVVSRKNGFHPSMTALPILGKRLRYSR